jgi:hypothetical protein
VSRGKSLLRRMAVRESGRLHRCRTSPKHPLAKGQVMLVITEDRDERHYCESCALNFITVAETNLKEIRTLLRPAVMDT